MLVHVALQNGLTERFGYPEKPKNTPTQSEVRILKFYRNWRSCTKTDFVPTTDNVLENLDYKDIRIKQHSWEEVKSELKKQFLKIDVRSVHGTRSTTNLEYHNIEEIDYNRQWNGLSVIA